MHKPLQWTKKNHSKQNYQLTAYYPSRLGMKGEFEANSSLLIFFDDEMMV